MRRPLEFSYDAELDVITIDGVTYACDLFRHFGMTPDPERLLRIVKNEDGIVTVRSYTVDLDKFERWYERWYDAHLKDL